MSMLRNPNRSRKTFWAVIFCAFPLAAFAANGNGMMNGTGSETGAAPAQAAPQHEAAGGATIREIQSALNQKDKAGLVVDGKLGAKTMAALKKFQKAHGLPETGRPNKKTDNALGL
ncbi:MAG: peptidoglycan-binding domain-containing protein [Gammaproteobacteria bacterium]|nr:peptidoglycan-binding domain-containing protein [Gammaproteobacteria bacterium]